ncbi:MAG: MBL fold metallo-hydrolase [Oscillospiraceae bacterium]|nr:MBL fold metallo-hydrolase [Oscillospiraceae bacterium]
MKLHFYGADRCVTGSCHCLEINGKKILVDCGLQQGRDELDNRYLAFAPGSIDILLVTHAHIDHTGRIPLLVKNGFHGRILTTRVTADLMKIMLLDSAHIQESDAEYENRKGERAGREHVEPLYTEQDALDVFKYVTTCEYEEKINLCEGVSAVFTDAGHLLGSASITLELEENGVHKTLVFSGDIGNVDQPIIRDPQLLKKADYVVMESTYGDRNHTEVWSYTDELAQIIDETLGKGGNVVIPSFAVGRTQELLYFIREIKDKGLVTSVKDFPVYVDSPLAKKATTIFCGDLRGYLDNDALALVQDGTHMFNFPGLHLTETVDESKLLNMDKTPKVIISASGMCDAGRIRHHLKYNLWRADSAVVFVGFQSPGTLGRNLLDGAESVRLFGEDIAVRAKIVNFQGLSSHADHDHLIDWIKHFDPARTTHVFVVHGDRDVAPVYADTVKSLGFAAHAPQYTEEYDLIADKQLSPGYLPERRTRAYEGAPKTTGAYQRLVQLGDMLVGLIRRSKGRDNKTLAAFAEAISKLISKFEF